MVKTDKLAILLATYNGEKYLEEQLESLLNQTYQEWIAYIHDDGSIDNTTEIIDRYCSIYPDYFIKIAGASTGGAKNNFYFLLQEIEAPYYMFCDQDDVWKNDKIKKTFDKMQEEVDSPIKMVFTDLEIVDSEKNAIAPSLWDYYSFDISNITFNSILIRNIVTGCTMMINKELRDRMLCYKNVQNVPMHDKWATLIALKFGKIFPLFESTIKYRQHAGNEIGAAKAKGYRYFVNKISDKKKIKRTYSYILAQAREFVDSFGLSEDDEVSQFVLYREKGKIPWIIFCIKHGFVSNRLIQIVSQILWG